MTSVFPNFADQLSVEGADPGYSHGSRQENSEVCFNLANAVATKREPTLKTRLFYNNSEAKGALGKDFDAIRFWAPYSCQSSNG